MSCKDNEELSDPVEHKFNYENAKIVFNQELEYVLRGKRLLNKSVRQKTDIDNIILDIILNKLNYKKYFSQKCQIINENGIYILGQVREIKKKVKNTKIMKVEAVKQFICLDELFDVMSELHMQKPSLSEAEILDLLSNCVVPIPLINLFLKSCETCHTKMETPDQHCLTISEMTIFKLGLPDGQFTEFLMYIDRNTNFVLLRPMKSTSDTELAYELGKIFADFPSPSYIYSNVRSSLKEYGQIGKIFHSTKPPFRMPVMFASNANHKIIPTSNLARIMLIDWMKETGSTNWAIGAHIVQWQMNTNKVVDTYIRSRVVSGPISSPYHAMFGLLPRTHLVQIKAKPQSRSTLKSDKVLVDCSQCHQTIYKVFKCYFCKRLCHFSCCIRFVDQTEEVPILINKCLSCVNPDSGEEMILGT